jgi:signal transduction histidine kinase
MRILLFLLLALVPLGAQAEVSGDAMVLADTMEGMEPSERVQFLREEVRLTLRNDPRRALELAVEFLAAAEEADDDAARHQAYLDIGVAHYFMGEYMEALRHYEFAMEVAVELGDKQFISKTRNNIGVLYFVWGEHDLALENYLQGLALQLEVGDKVGAARSYNNIAGVHQTAGRYESALEYYDQAIQLYREVGNLALEASTLNNIGLVRYEQGNYQEGIVPLERALVLGRELNDKPGEALSLNNIGMILAKLDRSREAEEHFTEALEIRREIGDRQGESVSLQYLGSTLVATGDMEAGIPLLEEALAIASDLEVQELIRDDYQALAEAWALAGDHEKALANHRKFKEAHDHIFDDERARQMAAAEARFELDLKDQEIQGLKREAEFLEFRRNILIVGAIASLLIIVLLWNRYRFQKRSNEERKRQNEALRQAHSDLETAAREELAHVARVATMGELTAAFAHELHQPLTAIKANVRAVRNLRGAEPGEPDVADEVLGYIREDAERAREIINRLREMMRKGEYRRQVKDVDDVIRAGVKFVEPTAGHQGVKVIQQLAGGLPPVHCDQIQIQQVLVNLVQNALAAMDDQEGDIVISTRQPDEDRIRVAVCDSGPPVSPDVVTDMFDPFFTTKPEGLGMGLPICRTIIEAHGGTLSFRKNETRGMTFEIDLPVFRVSEKDENAQ